MLSSRKHAKLVEKVQGKGTASWSGWGNRGRGKGKGDWNYANESGGKGKKGKEGNKGKNKNRGWGSQEKGGADWAKTQDKPEAAK